MKRNLLIKHLQTDACLCARVHDIHFILTLKTKELLLFRVIQT